MEDRARASEEEDPTHQPQVPDEVADADLTPHAVRIARQGVDRVPIRTPIQREGPAVDEILDVGGMEIGVDADGRHQGTDEPERRTDADEGPPESRLVRGPPTLD